MAKHQGITVKVGASYDNVTGPGFDFDRADIRKCMGKHAVSTLNRTVVEAWSAASGFHTKDTKRANRRANKHKDRKRG